MRPRGSARTSGSLARTTWHSTWTSRRHLMAYGSTLFHRHVPSGRLTAVGTGVQILEGGSGYDRDRHAPRRQLRCRDFWRRFLRPGRSEEHTSELQSLMRISYAVFCLKKKKQIAEAKR